MKKLTFAFIFAALAFTAPAQAETMNCTPITALPAVITVQGIYCFTPDLATAMTSGNAIDIQTSNVVLDLNGFKLGGLGAGLGTNAFWIHARDRQNITIKNGTIRGFFEGIVLVDAGASQGHIVEDIRADQNTFIGIDVGGPATSSATTRSWRPEERRAAEPMRRPAGSSLWVMVRGCSTTT